MPSFSKGLFQSLLCLSTVLFLFSCKQEDKPLTGKVELKSPRVLVFMKTKGYHHESIPFGAAAIMKLGKENGFEVDTTADAGYFDDQHLSKYSAVVFLSTTMNVLNADQQVAFERYIEAGGGFAGIHAAADTEYDWPWYNKLVGAYFLSHPHQQNATVVVSDKTHASTKHLPDTWNRYDEWYNYKNIYSGIKVLASLDESTYEGGVNGDNHPIAWYHEYDGGKAFYTGMGHTKESYEDPMYLKHILGGIQSVMASGSLDYSKSYSVKAPEDNRFTKTVLSNDLNEPMELIVAPDGRVFFTERAGKFYMYEPGSNKTLLLRDFPVKAVDKFLNGLIGVTLDPDFAKNNYIYFFYSSSTGDQLHQNISRFTLNGNALDTTSEKIIIKVPIDGEVSAHTGGSLAWDKNKNLYISTGDNTVPFESEGYAPIDERKDRLVYDAQRSAGNPNDLRGKILRIHPEPDGTYTIPEGNLFPKGTAGTRPEIYVMGCRNPYRISVDMETSILYWGEVGPDAGEDSKHGPRGYDEFNQARKAGNFGWPYFVGNNKAYNDSDFATKAIGALYDANAPVNVSPNNTGIQKLPPATPAMIWYPYANSAEFPMLGNGGRCAMGGPVYHYDASLKNDNRLPQYYDKALFVYDWMRNWVFAVRFDENHNYKRMEPFMQTNGDFRRPIDMEIAPNGVMYMLEYGSVYGIDNEDARLVRIDYNSGNRAPVASIHTNDTIGTAPFKVKLDGKQSVDLDDDEISYDWIIDGKSVSKEPEFEYSFSKTGEYKTVLKVTDPGGLTNTDTLLIRVGNTLPVVTINTTNNRSFFFDKPSTFNYTVNVTDKEDGNIDTSKVRVTVNYIPKLATAQSNVQGHQKMDETFNLGKELMAGSDCKACHQVNAPSVGPAFMEVSKKYADDKTAISRLANKIITGGSGVWGERAMSAHPQLSREDASEIVKYILSLSTTKDPVVLPASGRIDLKEHVGQKPTGRYFVTASYTDKGGAISPLTTKQMLILRPSLIQAEESDKNYNIDGWGGIVSGKNRSWFRFDKIDLKGISAMSVKTGSEVAGATISVRLDSLKGREIASYKVPAVKSREGMTEVPAAISDPGGLHDIYFIIVGGDGKRVGIDYIKVK